MQRKVVSRRSLSPVSHCRERLVGGRHRARGVEPTFGPSDVNGAFRVKVAAVNVSRETAGWRLWGQRAKCIKSPPSLSIWGMLLVI